MTTLTPRILRPLNSQTFFCSTCGIGEEGSCPGVHIPKREAVARDLKPARLIFALMAIAAVTFLFTMLGK